MTDRREDAASAPMADQGRAGGQQKKTNGTTTGDMR